MNEYENALSIARSIVDAKINPRQPGGTEAQLEQMYGVTEQILAVMAKNADDPAICGLLTIVRNARREKDTDIQDS